MMMRSCLCFGWRGLGVKLMFERSVEGERPIDVRRENEEGNKRGMECLNEMMETSLFTFVDKLFRER